VEAATHYIEQVSAPFGLKTPTEWRVISQTVIRRNGDGWVLHYDPRIGDGFRAITTEVARQAEEASWALWDRIHCQTLLIRGEMSDLLSRNTAEQMKQRGPKPAFAEFPGVGHAPMFMHDDQIAVVRDFLLNG
jgi:pimeloyl-ACP methyl ester carboxylesterase